MISMEIVFLFFLINVYMWNSNVCAIESSPIKNVYEFNAKVVAKEINGEIENLNDYKNKVLLIFNVSTNDKKSKNYTKLIRLANEYYNNGLRVLAFLCNQVDKGQNLDNGEKNDIFLIDIKEMSENKVVVFDNINVNGDDAHELWKYMKSVIPGEPGEENIVSSYEIFIIDKNGNVVERYNTFTNYPTIQEHILWYLNSREFAKNVYEFSVIKYDDGKLFSMENYKGSVLLIFNLSIWSIKDKNYDWLINLDQEYIEKGLKVLVFLYGILDGSDDNNTENEDLINTDEMKTKCDLFYDITNATNELWIYMKKKIPDDSDKHDLPDYTKFIVDKNGNVVKRFSHDQSIKDMNESLKNYLNKQMVNDEYESTMDDYMERVTT